MPWAVPHQSLGFIASLGKDGAEGYETVFTTKSAHDNTLLHSMPHSSQVEIHTQVTRQVNTQH